MSDSATQWTKQSMEFSRPEYWSGQPFLSSGDLTKPGIEPRYPTLQADSLPVEPQGKPKNTRVDSLSLLQQIFPIHESNQGFLLCRQIPYQLCYQRIPKYIYRPIQSTEFSKLECWSGQPFRSPGDLPNPGIKSRSPALQVDSLPTEPLPHSQYYQYTSLYTHICNTYKAYNRVKKIQICCIMPDGMSQKAPQRRMDLNVNQPMLI